jgi:hypothetical protein
LSHLRKEVEMADHALFIGWGTPVRGRERKAVQVFNESVQLWSAAQARGDIENFEVVLLEEHGGDLGGFALLRGEREKLDRYHASEEFQVAVARANFIVEGLGIVNAALGEAIARSMSRLEAVTGDLG